MTSSLWSYFLSCQMRLSNYLYLPRHIHDLPALESSGTLQTFRSLGPTSSCHSARGINGSVSFSSSCHTNTKYWEASIADIYVFLAVPRLGSPRVSTL